MREKTYRMSEVAEAMSLAASLPKIQEQAITRLLPLLRRLPIRHVSDLAQAIETHGGATYQELMKVRDVKVRVAVWYVDPEGRCQHKTYAVGNTRKAMIGAIGDPEWVEGWIA